MRVDWWPFLLLLSLLFSSSFDQCIIFWTFTDNIGLISNNRDDMVLVWFFLGFLFIQVLVLVPSALFLGTSTRRTSEVLVCAYIRFAWRLAMMLCPTSDAQQSSISSSSSLTCTVLFRVQVLVLVPEKDFCTAQCRKSEGSTDWGDLNHSGSGIGIPRFVDKCTYCTYWTSTCTCTWTCILGNNMYQYR